MSLRQAVVEVAVHHASSAGRGQGCVSVAHEPALLVDAFGEELPSCGLGPPVSSQHVGRVKNFMTHNT